MSVVESKTIYVVTKGYFKKLVASLLLLSLAQLMPGLVLAGFEPSVAFEVGGDIGPDAELVDDLNGDGIDDIIISLENKLMFLFGSTDGELKKKLALRFYYPISAIASGDFNDDGHTDVAIRTYYGKVLVYQNTGNAAFELLEVGSFNALRNGVFQAADFDDDGAIDLVIGGTVYYNEGDGAFGIGEALPVSAATGDINGDGLADIVDTYGEILCGLEDGSFEPCSQVTINGGLHASADIDSVLGLEILSWAPASYRQVARTYTVDHCGTGRTYRKRSGSRYVIRGNRYRRTTGCRYTRTIMQSVVASSSVVVSSVAEDGTVSEWLSDDVPGILADIQVADFNGDGNSDVLATNSEGNSYVFPGNGDARFGAAEPASVANSHRRLIVGDWNGDDSTDLAWFVVPGTSDTVLYSSLSAGTDPVVDPVVTEPAPAPEPDPTLSGETVEVDGEVEAFGEGYFVVNGITVSYDASSTIKFEDNTSGAFELGQPVQGKVSQYEDGSADVIKIQVGG